MKYITQEQRYTISVLLKSGKSKLEIAGIIGKHKSSVGREVQRNADKRNLVYGYELAQRKCMARHGQKPKQIRLTNTSKGYIDQKLADKFSPEQIVGRAALDGLDMVSHERIYQYVWQDKKKGGVLHEHLRSKGKRYRKRGAMKDKRGIISPLVVAGRYDLTSRPHLTSPLTQTGVQFYLYPPLHNPGRYCATNNELLLPILPQPDYCGYNLTADPAFHWYLVFDRKHLTA